MNKRIKLILIVLVILISSTIIYITYNYFRIKNAKIEVELKDDLGNNIAEEIKNAQKVVETFIQVKLSSALKGTTTDELNKNNASH